MDWDTRFGAFRQLLHTGVQAPRDLHQLLDLVDDAFLADPARYLEQWVGYAASLPSHTPPVIGCGSVSEFLFWSERAPFARFDVAFDDSMRLKVAFDALASSTHLGRVRSFSTHRVRMELEDALRLAELDGLSNLESLDLRFDDIEEEGFSALFDAGILHGLSCLRIPWCDLSSERNLSIIDSCTNLRELWVSFLFSADQLERFIALPSLSTLERLRVDWASDPRNNPTQCIHVLANAPHFTHLEHLDLGVDDSIDLSAARVLFESDSLPSLVNVSDAFLKSRNTPEACDAFFSTHQAQFIRRLDLGWAFDDVVLTALTQAEPLTSLHTLGVTFSSTFDLRQLADWPGLEHVSCLDLSTLGGAYDGGGLNALLSSAQTSGLRELTVPLPAAIAEFVRCFADSPALRGLELLRFGDARTFAPDGFEALFSSCHLSSLQTLDFGSFALSSASLDALWSCPHLTSLRHLRIVGENLRPRHIDALCSTPWFHQLEFLEIVRLRHARSPSRRPLDGRFSKHQSSSGYSQLITALAYGPLPDALRELRVPVCDRHADMLAPDDLTRLIARYELAHTARQTLCAPLSKQQLNRLARIAGFRRAPFLDRYELIETLRRFVMARNTSSI